jgi:hypothetical protein
MQLNIMFTYPTLLISYVYTVYSIFCILSMPHGHRSSIYLCTFSCSLLYTCVYKVVVVKLSRPDLRYLFFYICWLGQGVTRVGTLVFVCLGPLYVMGFLYLYVGLIWFPIRDSCLLLSLNGDHI